MKRLDHRCSGVRPFFLGTVTVRDNETITCLSGNNQRNEII